MASNYNRFIGDCRKRGDSMAEANAKWKAEHGGSVPHVSNPEGVIPEAVAVGAGIIGGTLVLGVLCAAAQRYLVGAQYGSVDWSQQMKGTGGLW